MIKYSLLLILSISAYLNLSAQEHLTTEEVQGYLIEAITHIHSLKLNDKKDFTIVKNYHYPDLYYRIDELKGNDVYAYEIQPPKLETTSSNRHSFPVDSISDIIWIRGKKWSGMFQTIDEVPFEKFKPGYHNVV